jgi:hypothetical protein
MKFQLNCVELKLELVSSGDGWHNGVVTTPDGQVFHVGGGWTHTPESALRDNHCRGLAVDACPGIRWPGAVEEGEFEAYAGDDIGDLDGLLRAVGLSNEERQQAVCVVQDASREAFLALD